MILAGLWWSSYIPSWKILFTRVIIRVGSIILLCLRHSNRIMESWVPLIRLSPYRSHAELQIWGGLNGFGSLHGHVYFYCELSSSFKGGWINQAIFQLHWTQSHTSGAWTLWEGGNLKFHNSERENWMWNWRKLLCSHSLIHCNFSLQFCATLFSGSLAALASSNQWPSCTLSIQRVRVALSLTRSHRKQDYAPNLCSLSLFDRSIARRALNRDPLPLRSHTSKVELSASRSGEYALIHGTYFS